MVMDISASKCDKFLGTHIGPEGCVEALKRMGMDACNDGDTVHVFISPVRLDIMHEVDIFEDVGIGYGFEKFGHEYRLDQTPGGLEPITSFSENVRDVMVGLGFMEVTTLTLSNEKDEFQTSRLPEMDNVRVLNPITEDHTCLRSYLMPSLVKILRHNKHRDLPQKIFEIGNVVRDQKVNAHLCAMATASKTSFTEIKSITASELPEHGCEYELKASDLETFIDGRGASVLYKGREIGIFGEMNPEVVVGFEITHPIVFMELDLEPIIADNRDTLF